MQVAKVAGNFHLAPGRSFEQGNMHVHDLAPFQGRVLDFAHTVKTLSFGKQYPGMRNPLDNVQNPPKGTPQEALGMFSYFLKVVPTIYTDLGDDSVHSNQFSVTEHYQEAGPGKGRHVPGLFFFYELSPIKIKITEQRNSFLHFLTNVCAVVGGVFTVSGIIDAGIYHGERVLRKKHQMGKLM